MQVPVEVLGIIFDEEDKTGALAGDNVKLKLRGVEEEVCIILKGGHSYVIPANSHAVCTSLMSVDQEH